MHTNHAHAKHLTQHPRHSLGKFRHSESLYIRFKPFVILLVSVQQSEIHIHHLAQTNTARNQMPVCVVHQI